MRASRCKWEALVSESTGARAGAPKAGGGAGAPSDEPWAARSVVRRSRRSCGPTLVTFRSSRGHVFKGPKLVCVMQMAMKIWSR